MDSNVSNYSFILSVDATVKLARLSFSLIDHNDRFVPISRAAQRVSAPDRDVYVTLCTRSASCQASAAAKHEHSKPAIPELLVFALTGAIDINMQTVIQLVTLWIFYIS